MAVEIVASFPGYNGSHIPQFSPLLYTPWHSVLPLMHPQTQAQRQPYTVLNKVYGLQYVKQISIVKNNGNHYSVSSSTSYLELYPSNNPLPRQHIRMLLISLFYGDVAQVTSYITVISLPGVWSCTLVSGYTRYKCVKRPPPREGYNYYLNKE